VAFLIDLHAHTRLGSLDSTLDPAVMVEHARRRGIHGVAVTEHYRLWAAAEAARWSTEDVRIYPAAEVATDAGHVLAFGFSRFPTARTLADLADEAEAAGATLVLAHPYRGFFDSPHHWLRAGGRPVGDPVAEALCRGGRFVHEIEVDNNGCTERENALAGRLAAAAGRHGVGGSDAHIAAHVGRHATRFEALPRDARELAALIRERRTSPHAPRACGLQA
jgi:predicted metal-dependent phosphoesterase TrpH